MNLYERIKASVTPRDAAERYGLTVNRNGMARCPFHPDKHPSMKLYDDHFYCFSCHAAGDVIDLTAKLFGCSNHDAARRLAADYGIDPTQPPVALRLRKPREENLEKLSRRFLTEYFQLLNSYKRNFAPKGTLELVDERYLEACRNIDGIEYLLDCIHEHGRTRLDTTEPCRYPPESNFGDGESVLALLYEAYADCNTLYRLMNGMELREMDKNYLPCLYPLPGSSTIGIY